MAQSLNCVHRLTTALDFKQGHAIGIRPIATSEMDQVHIGHFPTIVHGPPCASYSVEMRWDETILDSPLEWLCEKGGEHIIFFAICFDHPFARRPIFICLWICIYTCHKRSFINTREMEHNTGGLHLFNRCF